VTLYRLLRRRRVWLAAILIGLVAAGVVVALPYFRAWHHLRAARLSLDNHHNPQAIRHIRACLQFWPEDADVLLMAARAARRAQAYAEAERCLQKYQQARGFADAAALEQLLLSAERRVEQVASTCRRKVEEEDPDTPLILEALARGYLRRYRLREAHSCLDRWLKAQPDNPQALCMLGGLYLDYEHARYAALERYSRAVEVDDDHEEARLGLAITLLQLREFAEAAAHLERLLQSQPDNLRVRVGLAECRDALSDTAEAVRLLDEVLAQQPSFAPALAVRGRIALRDGQYAAAESALRLAVTRNPSDHDALYNLIRCLQHNGKQDEAQRVQEQLRQTEADVKRVEQIVTREMGQRPLDPVLHATLGQLLLRNGHRDEGLRWLQSALRLDPKCEPARRILAEYSQPGQP